VIEWFGGSLVSRLIDKRTGAIVAVMQPLRQGDLHGPGSFAEFLIQALQAQGVRSRRRIQHWFQRDAETWGAGASSIFLMWKTSTLENLFIAEMLRRILARQEQITMKMPAQWPRGKLLRR
jgi:hypothetical protein